MQGLSRINVATTDADDAPGSTAGASPRLNAQENALLTAIQRASHRSIPPFALQDALGSALLHARNLLPAYDLFRIEDALLRDNLPQIVAWARDWHTSKRAQRPAAIPPEARRAKSTRRCQIVDLGCTAGLKTGRIAEAITASMGATVFAVNRSTETLGQFNATLADLSAVRVVPIALDFLPALRVVCLGRQDDAPLLTLLLDSTISQFDVADIVPFLAEVQACMRPGDALLIGAAGIRPHAETVHHHDDALGIEAAFNKNALNVINRALGSDFDIAAFDYTVRTQHLEGLIRCQLDVVKPALVARTTQWVTLRKARTTLVIEEGERLNLPHTVNFGVGSIAAMAHSVGFAVLAEWRDAKTGFTDTFLLRTRGTP